MINWPQQTSDKAEVTQLPMRGNQPGAEPGVRGDANSPRVVEPGNLDPRLVCMLRPASPEAESYFRLRHSLESMSGPDGSVVVGVTSPGVGDGKSLTAINLAAALARDSEAGVLLVDLDLRGSGQPVSEFLDIDTGDQPGLAQWLADDSLAADRVRMRLAGCNLDYVPGGGKVEYVYDLLRSPKLGEYLDEARRHYRFIVVDTPHALLMSDIPLISAVVDGFLVVVRADHTTRDDLESTLNVISQHKVLGLVFNDSPTPRRQFAA